MQQEIASVHLAFRRPLLILSRNLFVSIKFTTRHRVGYRPMVFGGGGATGL